MVVGDDRQAIYGFRGADAGSIDRLKSELKAQELGLTTTYRCGKTIVDSVRHIVPDFEAGASNPEGVIDACGHDELFALAQPGDFVLSRKNGPLMGLCLGFLKRGVRARIEGRDLGKQLRETVASFKARSVPQFIERVQGWAAKKAQRIGKIDNEDVRAARLADVADQVEVLVGLAEGAINVAEILTRCETLFGDATEKDRKPEVVCSSVHKAKGLEAEHVFILEDTVSQRGEEEKNIFYVAVTRAKGRLTWVKPAVAAPAAPAPQAQA